MWTRKGKRAKRNNVIRKQAKEKLEKSLAFHTPHGKIRFAYTLCQVMAAEYFRAAPDVWQQKIGAQVASKVWDEGTMLPAAIRATGIAMIRHCLTPYDDLMSLGDAERDEAREMVAKEITRIYTLWVRGSEHGKGSNTQRMLP